MEALVLIYYLMEKLPKLRKKLTIAPGSEDEKREGFSDDSRSKSEDTVSDESYGGLNPEISPYHQHLDNIGNKKSNKKYNEISSDDQSDFDDESVAPPPQYAKGQFGGGRHSPKVPRLN